MLGSSSYPTHRSAEGAWFTQVPSHWHVKRLKHIALVNPTSDRAEKDETVTFLPMEAVSASGTYDSTRTNIRSAFPDSLTEFKVGDVILAKITPCFENGKGAYIEHLTTDKGIGSTEFHVFRVAPNLVEPRFLYHLVRNEEYRSFAETFMIGTAGQKRLTTAFIANSYFPVPPISEQTRIAAFLDAQTTEIDAAIAKKQRLIELLQEQKAILINRAVTKGLDPGAPLRDSGETWIGEIPAHWELKKVKHIFSLIVDPAPKNNDYELLSIYSDIGVRPRKELEERGNRASTTDGYWRVQRGDFIVNKLLAWMGAIGLSEYDGVTSPAYDILRPQLPIAGYYYHALFRSSSCTSELKRHSRGIMDMRLRLYFDEFGALQVPFPSLEEQIEITQRLKELDVEYDAAEQTVSKEIQLLTEYKSVLISSAVTGKIKV